MKKKLTEGISPDREKVRKIWMTMRLIVFLFFVSLVHVSASVYSQKTKLNIKLENATLQQAFNAIQEQSEFDFFYKNEQIPANARISVQYHDEAIEVVLDKILKGTGLIYHVMDKDIVISAGNLLNNNNVNSQQQKSISGKVSDSLGGSLPGVSVVLKGTTTGVITDMDGRYAIAKLPENAILQFSFVGMKTKEIAVGVNPIIDVILTEETVGIEEVVAVGYGTQKKVNLTGSVGIVNTKELSGQVPTSATSLLQGRLPGVFVTEGSGQPGKTNMNVLIRGLGTMNNSNPMVLIDGIESTMNDINPNDIESVNVLKDAAAASIYGTRAANGVILVTTKRGDVGHVKVSYNTSMGTQNVINKPEKLDSWDQATLMNEAYTNNGLNPIYTVEEIRKFKSGEDPYKYPNTDWMNLLLQGSGFMQTHNLNFSGGTEAARFLLSMESFDQKGLVKYVDYQRSNLRFNLDSKVNRWLNIGLNSSLLRNVTTEPTQTFNTSGISEYFRQAQYVPSTAPFKNENGDYVPWTNGNPIAWLEQGGKYTSNNYHALGSVFGEVNLMKGLVLKGIIGLNFNFNDNKNHIKSITYSTGLIQGPNSVEDILTRDNTVNLQSYLTYSRSFKDHNIKAMLGVSRESYTYKYDQLYRNSLPSNELDQINAGASSSKTNAGTESEAKIGSYFGRINYNYKERYLFEANVRHDGSSKFGSEYRWGTFPSFSVGWRATEEEFMKSISWINNLKFRGSWGMLGNHNISDYLYIATISLGQNYPFGGAMQSGAATTKAEVPDISWESTTEWDIGFDASFFQNKFSTSIDYYNRFTDDILTSIPISPVFGLAAPVVNGGAMRNTGLEIQVSHTNKIGGLEYNLSANVSFNDNKVEKFPKPSIGNTIRMEGYSWDSYFGYESIGIYQTDEEAKSSAHIVGAPVKAGDLIFKDQNNDGVVDTKDRIVLGNQIPGITYGFDISLLFKNFDFSMNLQGVGNAYNQIGNVIWPFTDGGAGYKRNLDRTIVENGKVVTQGHYPRVLMNESTGHNGIFSSFQVESSAYLRLKNVQLGYTLPKSLTEKVKLSKVRIYFSGKNLLTFTKFFKDYDPELRGSANYVYPQVQVFTLGLNVNF